MVKGDQWAGYEDATSITKKVKHVKELTLPFERNRVYESRQSSNKNAGY